MGGGIGRRQDGDARGVDPFVQRWNFDRDARGSLHLGQFVLRNIGDDAHVLGIKSCHQRFAGRDGFPHFDVACRDNAGERCGNDGITAERCRLPGTGACGARTGFGGAIFSGGAVERGLTDEFLLKQLLLAFVIGAGVGECRGGLSHLCLATGNGGRKLLRGEPNDDCAGLDVIAGVKVDRRDASRHLGRNR